MRLLGHHCLSPLQILHSHSLLNLIRNLPLHLVVSIQFVSIDNALSDAYRQTYLQNFIKFTETSSPDHYRNLFPAFIWSYWADM